MPPIDPLTSAASKALSDHERKKKKRIPSVQANRKPDYRVPPLNARTPRRG